MEPIGRLEIVTASSEIDPLCAYLEELGAPGFTVIREVEGKGDRGSRSGDEMTDAFKNGTILVACDLALAEEIAEKIDPVIRRHGGICLLSEARWLPH